MKTDGLRRYGESSHVSKSVRRGAPRCMEWRVNGGRGDPGHPPDQDVPRPSGLIDHRRGLNHETQQLWVGESGPSDSLIGSCTNLPESLPRPSSLSAGLHII